MTTFLKIVRWDQFLFLTALMTLCVGTVAAAAPLTFVVAPTLTLDPNGVTPLAAIVECATSEPASAVLTVAGPSILFDVALPDLNSIHEIPVLGLLANTNYTVTVEFEAAGGETVVTPSLPVTTAPLPVDFPSISVTTSMPSLMEPGFTLLDRFTRNSGEQYTIIVNDDGDVVWYSTSGGTAIKQLANGNLSWRLNDTVQEMDMLGNVRPTIFLSPGDLHHDLVRTPHGIILSLSKEIISVVDYPTSETDPQAPPATQDVEADVTVEYSSAGVFLRSWSLGSILDTLRIGYGSLNPRAAGELDWSHGNAIIHDPSDDSLIVSLRHQDALVKLDRMTGALIWILGPHDNWGPAFQPFLLTPVGALDWQYHQHAPMITGSGTLVLFDNGNFRASPFDGNTPMDGPSRAVEFSINETTMEVTQVWSFGSSPDPEAYSERLGDADWLPQTGNVLLNYGNTISVNGVASADLGLGPIHARIVEVDHSFPAQIVFEMSVYDPVSGLRIYRVERIPSLYSLIASNPSPVPGLSVMSLLLLCGLIAASVFAFRSGTPGPPFRGSQ